MSEKHTLPRKPVGSNTQAPKVQQAETQHGAAEVTHIPTTDQNSSYPEASHPLGVYDHHSSRPNFLSKARTSNIAFLDRNMPSHKRYVGLKRRTLLWIILALVVCLLALIIGLAVRLTAGKEPLFLPLPSDKQSFTGDLTYYGTGLGACGVTSSDSDNIVSVSHFLFDHEQQGSDPNSNPLCGKMIRVERVNEESGKRRSVDLRVVDRCTGCQPTDLDVSLGAFTKLANQDLGRVTMTWAWLSEEPS